MQPAQKSLCVRIRLRADSLPRVREWAAHLEAHRGEVVETLKNETVSIESVFLQSDTSGDFLIYYMRAESFEQARMVADKSMATIDQYHQTFKRDVWLEREKLELLVDFAV